MQKSRNSYASLIRCTLIQLFLILNCFSLLYGQGREFSFNTPGNSCYFKYVCFVADSNYSLIRRPYIFILSDENVTPEETMARDTLKNSLHFSNYFFVYLPNTGSTPFEKLGCTEALVDLLTSNFRYGKSRKSNLFLQVNDTLITRDDIVSVGLNNIFSTVRLNLEQKYLHFEPDDSVPPLAEFKEVAVEPEPEEREMADKATY
jgi:hypothetical protein